MYLRHATSITRGESLQRDSAYFTSPSSASFSFVSSVSGVEASIQTPPACSLIAVERPPIGSSPKRVNPLCTIIRLSFEPHKLHVPRERPDVLSDLACNAESNITQSLLLELAHTSLITIPESDIVMCESQ